jgi:pseudaminic acid biosynthesis-associated methylase
MWGCMERNEQEQFWAGDFGTSYIARNEDPRLVSIATTLLSRVLARAPGIESVLELGANIGNNLLALRHLFPEAHLAGVEINEAAFRRLAALAGVRAHHGSLLQYRADEPVDLAFTRGVLIHIDPDDLPRAYDALYAASRRYVALIEYYNPTPVEVTYRGHAGKLFKRDWCAEIRARHPDLALRDYGFVYHGDALCPADDLTWFLLERAQAR